MIPRFTRDQVVWIAAFAIARYQEHAELNPHEAASLAFEYVLMEIGKLELGQHPVGRSWTRHTGVGNCQQKIRHITGDVPNTCPHCGKAVNRGSTPEAA